MTTQDPNSPGAPEAPRAPGVPAGPGTPAAGEVFIGVAVATLWREPDSPREIDLPALGHPVDLRAWLRAMDLEAKRGLVGRVETQALLGQPVVVLEERGDWVRIAVPDQPEPGQPLGYPGWVPAWQLSADPAMAAAWQQAGASVVTVRALTAWLHHRPHPAARWMEVSFGTRLPAVDRREGWVAVSVPAGPAPAAPSLVGAGASAAGGAPQAYGSAAGGPAGRRQGAGAIGWLRLEDVRLEGAGGSGPGSSPHRPPDGRPEGPPAPAAAPSPGPGVVAGSSLLETARRFLGVPYLWGGTSGFGVDCSGFMYLVHRFHGLIIPRDAAPQRDHGGGRPVEQADLQAGDLVFFAHQGGQGAVHHVGMVAGEGRMIHAPNSERVVEVIPLDQAPYGEKYAGARRFHRGSAAT